MTVPLFSMRKTADALGISLKGLQNAIKTGRVSIQHERQAGTRKRFLFDIVKARAEFDSTRSRGARATRGESGAPPATNGKASAAVIDPSAPDPSPDLLENMAPETDTPETPENNNYKPSPDQKMITSAKAQKELYSGKMAELDYKVKSGEFVSIEVAKKLFNGIAVNVKQNILSIPDRISSILSAETDERQIHNLLSTELKQALKEMAGGNLEIEPGGK